MDEKLKKAIREHKFKVYLEPELEELAGTMTPAERRALAKIYFRRARQLFASARVLENLARIQRRPFRWLRSGLVGKN